ncbi:MAG: 30S ribosomal protein S6 [bacterium]|nr:30S ribosomal protein S6 [bacterium]
MTEYQIALLYSPQLNEADLAKANARVEGLIKEVGEVKQQNTLEKIKLGYPVKKQTEAFFTWLFFQAEAETIIPLQNKLKEEKDVLRLLLIKDKLEKRENKKKSLKKKIFKEESEGLEESEEKLEEKAPEKEESAEEEKIKEKKSTKKKESDEEKAKIDEELEKVLND